MLFFSWRRTTYVEKASQYLLFQHFYSVLKETNTLIGSTYHILVLLFWLLDQKRVLPLIFLQNFYAHRHGLIAQVSIIFYIIYHKQYDTVFPIFAQYWIEYDNITFSILIIWKNSAGEIDREFNSLSIYSLTFFVWLTF